MNQEEVKRKLEEFFKKKLDIGFDTAEIDYDTDLIETGKLDSLSFLVLTSYIEKTFKVKVLLNGSNTNQMSSLNKIAAFIVGQVGN